MVFLYVIFIIILSISITYSESYALEWSGAMIFIKSITHQDKNIF